MYTLIVDAKVVAQSSDRRSLVAQRQELVAAFIQGRGPDEKNLVSYEALVDDVFTTSLMTTRNGYPEVRTMTGFIISGAFTESES